MFEDIQCAAREEDPTGQKVIVEPTDNRFRQQLADAKLLIARAGGATLMESVYLKKPTVAVPRPYHGMDREQQERAMALAKLGHVRMITHPELIEITERGNYSKFAAEVNAAWRDREHVKPEIDMRGADNAAHMLHAISHHVN